MKNIIAAVLALAVMLPLATHAAGVSVSVGGAGMIIPDKGFDPFAGNDSFGLGGLAVGVRPFRGAMRGLGLEVGYAGGSSQDSVWNTFDTSLSLNLLSAGASYRYDRFDWFAPYARLLATVVWGDAEVKTAAGTAISDSATVFGGSLALGFELVTPRAWLRPDDDDAAWYRPANLGVYLEAGYGFYGALDFSKASVPSIESSDVTKQAQEAAGPALGDVNLSGPTIRAGFVANF
ncbi:MAG: outer membrane beta-barrel protein [Kiritimatiellae bacterium]|nr:outer membrane beta-barrel protein [Kiritimatiellia bacterium]